MIPRKIKKGSVLSPGKVVALLSLGLAVLAAWGAGRPLPLWARALGALLIVAPGLYLTFGTLHGKPVTEVLKASVYYLLRPQRLAWSRGESTPIVSAIQLLPDWWWRLAALMPDRGVIIAAAVAAACSILIAALMGLGLNSEASEKPSASRSPLVSQLPSLTPAPSPTLTPKPSPTATPTPSPTSTPSPTPSPTPPPKLTSTPLPTASTVIWEDTARPGYIRLSSPASTPISISLTLTGSRSYRYELILRGEGIVLLYPLYHPHVSQVRVWSALPVEAQIAPHQFYAAPESAVWWLPTAGLTGKYLKLHPLGGGRVTVESPQGETVPLAAGRWTRVRHRGGLYRIEGSFPFPLECGVFQW